MQLIRIGEVEV